jgi:arylsulfatase A-like enzyme
VVYDIEPFRAAVRKGTWKPVWQATLPSRIELFNLAEDPGEQTNLADRSGEKVVELQQRVEALAREAAVTLPGEEQALEKQP